MYDINELLIKTLEMKASDLHLTVGSVPILRINGDLVKFGENVLLPDDTKNLVEQILNVNQMSELLKSGDYDLSYSVKNYGRFRVNVYKQRGSFGMAIRSVANKVPNLEELLLPPVLKEIARKKRGLVLVTGPTGSGKSTTLASMIDRINNERSCHILTLEDPIEYLHSHNKSIVNQRELKNDFLSFSEGLRAGLRQDPDVILLGEMRDIETMQIALTAAETGHIVFSTLHTMGATSTIDRIIDAFPPHQQQQVVVQLANVLEAVVSQQLLPREGGGRVVGVEIMVTTPAIKNLIRERKTHQIQSSIQTGSKFGMQTMDSSVLDLYNKGLISKDNMIRFSVDNEFMLKM